MLTLARMLHTLTSIPASTGWLLSDLGEYRGMQELFTRQAPQRLKTLKEFSVIESAVSSNRIEGIEIDHSRIKSVVFGHSDLSDRNEEEIRGYRQALDMIHNEWRNLRIFEPIIKKFHRVSRGDVWDAGMYKEKDSDIIQTYPDGRSRIRFKTVSANKTPEMMASLIDAWDTCTDDNIIHILISNALFNLDFLCIHPFRDGNGRVSRLLFLLQCYYGGYEVGKYISLERLIEENKERYYETLEKSSEGWHEGRNDPWPYVNYMLFILKSAYAEFKDRAGHPVPRRGEKTGMIQAAVDSFSGDFSIAQLKAKCPEVSLDMIRKVLKEMQKKGRVESTGRGRGATWHKLGTIE